MGCAVTAPQSLCTGAHPAFSDVKTGAGIISSSLLTNQPVVTLRSVKQGNMEDKKKIKVGNPFLSLPGIRFLALG